MEEILLGMIGMALMLAAFALGVAMGREKPRSSGASAADDTEAGANAREEARQAQMAFDDLMHYNAEDAYLMNGSRDGGDAA